MLRRTALATVLAVVAALLIGTATSQEKKDKAKGQLPPGWKKLNLSKDQVIKIYDIQGKYKSKIKDLQNQIADLQKQEKSEMVSLLTEDQKEMLRNLALGEEKKKGDAKPKSDK